MDSKWKAPTVTMVSQISVLKEVNQTKAFDFSCLVISNFYNKYIAFINIIRENTKEIIFFKDSTC